MWNSFLSVPEHRLFIYFIIVTQTAVLCANYAEPDQFFALSFLCVIVCFIGRCHV